MDTLYKQCKYQFDMIMDEAIHVTESTELPYRKKEHTDRVVGHVREILKESGARKALCDAIEAAALLHDIGRFMQMTGDGIYDESVGMSHAEEGAGILSRSDCLESLGPNLRETVITTVKYHNLAVLPDGLAPDARLALEVVRDADKLDAIRNHLKSDARHGKVVKLGLKRDDLRVSESVLERASKRQLVPCSELRYSNDFILFLCCWIYDMHFHYTFDRLQQSGLYRELLDRLPDNAAVTPVKEQLAEDLDWIAFRARPQP